MDDQTQPDQPSPEQAKGRADHLRPHWYQPGQSGNPKGRPRIGATIIEQINALGVSGLSRQQLERISNDESEGAVRRYAAGRLLVMMELGDVADFDEFLEGRATIAQLRRQGVNTRVIKKAKVTRKIVGRTGAGEAITEEVRELEFYDRAETTAERIIDRTNGKPVQTIKTDGEDDQVTTIRIVTPLTRGQTNAGEKPHPNAPPLDDAGQGEERDPGTV